MLADLAVESPPCARRKDAKREAFAALLAVLKARPEAYSLPDSQPRAKDEQRMKAIVGDQVLGLMLALKNLKLAKTPGELVSTECSARPSRPGGAGATKKTDVVVWLTKKISTA